MPARLGSLRVRQTLLVLNPTEPTFVSSLAPEPQKYVEEWPVISCRCCAIILPTFGGGGGLGMVQLQSSLKSCIVGGFKAGRCTVDGVGTPTPSPGSWVQRQRPPTAYSSAAVPKAGMLHTEFELYLSSRVRQEGSQVHHLPCAFGFFAVHAAAPPLKPYTHGPSDQQGLLLRMLLFNLE